jgi:hypothetical protein
LLHVRVRQGNAAATRVYPALTIIRKDCGQIGEKRQQRISGHGYRRYLIVSAANIACTTSGNGEQAWL